MPIIPRGRIKDVNAMTSYLHIIGKTDDGFPEALSLMADMGIGPGILLLNIIAHESAWDKTFMPQKVIDRLDAMEGPNAAVMYKAILARQWRWLWWVRFIGCGAAIFALLAVLFVCSFAIECWSRVWSWFRK